VTGRDRQAGLLSTGEAARLLGSSRQHVVDLCTRGELPFVWVGRHRRVPTSAVDGLLERQPSPLTRDQERSLWLHRALLARLVTDPDDVLGLARANVAWLLELHKTQTAARWLAEWKRILDSGVDEVADLLTSRSPLAVELRQNSPFAGALSQETRSKVLAAFVKHWHTEHAADGSRRQRATAGTTTAPLDA
jgi:excisionase family DNA binding protein